MFDRTRLRDTPRPLLFAYWGARGALPKFTLELAKVAASQDKIGCTFCVSSSNELLPDLSFLDDALLSVSTFSRKLDAFAYIGRVHDLRSRLTRRIATDGTRTFVSLMTHVWSPLIMPAIRRTDVKHVVLAHDADPHPGDYPSLLNWWLRQEGAAAARIVTLSEYVAERLVARGIPRERLSVLFHPDLDYSSDAAASQNRTGPLRILFFGRILAYKGLDVFIAATERLITEGFSIEVGVFGEGSIGKGGLQRLRKLGAEVENRWLLHEEIKALLSRYDIVVASHIEASQSGIIASAFGAGLPVVATPIGGLTEQIEPDVTGVIAESDTADSLAAAIRKIAVSSEFLAHLRRGIIETRQKRSMQRFFDELCAIAL